MDTKSADRVRAGVIAALAAAMAQSVAAAPPAPSPTGTDEDLQEIVVTGYRASLNLADEIKKNDPNVVDSIVARDVGKLPDVTVGDALQRITGVQVTRNNNQVVGVNVRGLPNVVTMRTFSKIYGLAGERIGWAYGPQAIIDVLHTTRPPFNVTTAGQSAAIAALADQDWIDKAKAHNKEWRAWLTAEIESMGNWGVRAVPSAANFVLVIFPDEGPRTAEAANRHLTSQGYLTRWLPKQDLANGLRISIGTEEETRGVAAVLRTFLETAD